MPLRGDPPGWLDLAPLHAALDRLSPEQLPDAIGALEAVKPRAWARLAAVPRLTAAGELPVVHPNGRRAVRYRARDLAELTRMRTTPIRQGRRTTTDREPIRPLAAPQPVGWES
jgi:hypothetical protein